MKQIEFKQNASQKIYRDYLKRIEKTIKILSKDDREEILMEFNSHIYEGVKNADKAKEVDTLLSVLDKLGIPEEVLKPLLADKKIEQATRTFNPIHIFQALILNISNGITYVIFSIMYLFLFSGILLIIAKIFIPEVGFYYKENEFFILGLVDNNEAPEILVNWFIPVMLITTIILYFLITLLLKIKNKRLKKIIKV